MTFDEQWEQADEAEQQRIVETMQESGPENYVAEGITVIENQL